MKTIYFTKESQVWRSYSNKHHVNHGQTETLPTPSTSVGIKPITPTSLEEPPLPCQASTGPEDLWFRSSGWSTTRRRRALSSEILVINPTQIIIKVRDETKPNEKDMVGFEVWPILKPSLKKCWWDLNRKLKWVSWTSEGSQSEYIGRVAAWRFNMWGVFFDNDNEGTHQ